MNSVPMVSVLMTAYNREKYIRSAIESVLASSLSDFELIVVDDGSTDGTPGIARDYASKDARIRIYVNEKNLGQFQNRNKAAYYASGKYLKYVDSDDMILPETLALMAAGMEQYPEAGIGLVYNDMEKIDLRVTPYKCFSSRDAYLWHYSNGGMLFPGPTGCIFRKDYFFEQGGFPLNLGINGDIYLNLRIAAVSPVVIFPGNIVFWRKHAEQVDELQQDYFKMHKERYLINKKNLFSDQLPLDEFELRRIRIGNKILFIRGAIFRYLLKWKVQPFLKLLKEGNIPIFSFPIAALPLRYINSFKKLSARQSQQKD
jgi:glycosyltransferase involved in cell wall biosynthesis